MLFAILSLVACGSRDTLAPVVEPGFSIFNKNASKHIVKKGETLYSIAFKYDLDYLYLARINRINSPYNLAVGQVLILKAKYSNRKLYTRHVLHRSVMKPKTGSYKTAKWIWPARGKISSYFAPRMGNKGINISGRKGDKIYASASGVVAFAGNGLANYGNLIIIKHNDNYLTAYGNNARNLVKEGTYVHSGQVIAEMGIIDHRYYGLHFEMRKRGTPVNPKLYLH